MQVLLNTKVIKFYGEKKKDEPPCAERKAGRDVERERGDATIFTYLHFCYFHFLSICNMRWKNVTNEKREQSCAYSLKDRNPKGAFKQGKSNTEVFSSLLVSSTPIVDIGQ